MKILAILLILLTVPFILLAQDIQESAKKVKSFVSSEYDRNAATFVGIDFNENWNNDLFTKFSDLKVPDKYYDNSLEIKVIKPGVSRESVSNMYTGLDENKISVWLNQNKIGQQIIAKWFNRQSDGSFNVDVLKERGLFNANDNDFMVASASKRGESSLMDMGLQLVSQSYLLAFDFTDLMNMTQYYDKNEIPAEKRVMNGFKSSVNTYLFKLDFNDSVAAVFFQQYWAGANDPNLAAKKDAFENAVFPFVFVGRQHNDITSAQYNEGQPLAPKVQKSNGELLMQMNQMALDAALTDIENQNQDFRVKAMVSEVRPISAKIGKKEGLKFDQRYFVFENRQRNNGTLYSKRVAVVKSMKVVDNRQVTTGETKPSTFYQIAGGKVDNYGMFLEQHNDIGLNIFLGSTFTGLTGYTGRAEYYISKTFGGMVGSGSGRGATSWKIYAEGGYDLENDYEAYFLNEMDNFTFLRVSFGLAKDFYPASFIHWGPFIGYGVESISWESSDIESISSDFVEVGVRVGINLAHNIQLIGSATYYSLLTSQKENTDTQEKLDFEYKDNFEDRMGLSFSAGIRFMF